MNPLLLALLLPVLRIDARHLNTPQTTEQRLQAYQHLHALVALQGIVNREAPRLFLAYEQVGDIADLQGWWLERAMAILPVPGSPLHDLRFEEIQPLDLPGLVRRFEPSIRGLVVWDPATPATAHIATALAGAENLLPVTPAGYPHSLLPAMRDWGLEIRRDLTATVPEPRTGSRKCDWYLWLVDQVRAGVVDANTTELGYYPDAWAMTDREGHWGSLGLANLDDLVARRGVPFDLSMWPDERPVDDPEQPLGADTRTLERLLSSFRELSDGAILRIHGFPPWQHKYSEWRGNGRHPVVAGEWQAVEIFSRHGAVLADSDAPALVDFANGSFWRHLRTDAPLPLNDDRNRARTEVLPNRVRVCWLMGDYDSSAWMSQTLPTRWFDPGRGQVPLAWMMGPLCFERAPHILQVLHRTRSPQDHFVAYNGLGYLNPNSWPDLEQLRRATGQAFEALGYSIIGCAITPPEFGLRPDVAAVYAEVAPDGIGLHPGAPFTSTRWLVGDTPVAWNATLTDFSAWDSSAFADEILFHHHSGSSDSLLIRAIQVTPTFVLEVMSELNRDGDRFQAVDPFTFFAELREEIRREEDAPAPASAAAPPAAGPPLVRALECPGTGTPLRFFAGDPDAGKAETTPEGHLHVTRSRMDTDVVLDMWSAPLPVVPGNRYTGILRLRPVSGRPLVRVNLFTLDAAGNWVGDPLTRILRLAPGAGTYRIGPVSPPERAAGIGLALRLPEGATVAVLGMETVSAGADP